MSSEAHSTAPDPGQSSDLRIDAPDSGLPPIERLRRIVHLLRAPGGCPWDREQDHRSLVPLLLEEAYEVAEAIGSGDDAHTCEELGDLLLHVVMHGEMGGERGAFDLDRIAAGVAEKMIRRHPHVFGSASAGDSEAVLRQWDEIKKVEKSGRETQPVEHESHLTGISRGLPGLIRAHKLQKRAAKVGFEFDSLDGVMGKVREELAEVEEVLAGSGTGVPESGVPESGRTIPKRLEEELGDVLFAVVNLTRWLGSDAETLLAAANRKFETRFAAMENRLEEQGESAERADLATMEAAWQAAKEGP